MYKYVTFDDNLQIATYADCSPMKYDGELITNNSPIEVIAWMLAYEAKYVAERDPDYRAMTYISPLVGDIEQLDYELEFLHQQHIHCEMELQMFGRNL